MNKIAYIGIGMVFTLILSFSWISLADNNQALKESNNQSTTGDDGAMEEKASNEGTVDGTVSFLDNEKKSFIIFDGQKKHHFSINPETKVMLNEKEAQFEDIQLGDELKIVSNSQGIVRYVVVHHNRETKSALGNVTAQAGENETKKNSTEQNSTANDTSQADLSAYEELKIELKQDDKELEIKWDGKNAKIEWETDEGDKELKGTEAKKVLADWFGKWNDTTNEREEMLADLIRIVKIDVDKPFTFSFEWQKNGKKGKWETQSDKEDNGKHLGHSKHKEKIKDKAPGHQNHDHEED